MPQIIQSYGYYRGLKSQLHQSLSGPQSIDMFIFNETIKLDICKFRAELLILSRA